MSFVPSQRLLRAVLLAVLLAAVAGPLPGLAPLWLVALLLLVLAALADLGLSARLRLPEVGAPAVVRFSKDRPGVVPVSFHGHDATVRQIRLGLGLPPGFADADPDQVVALPAGGARARFDWRCVPAHRGRFRGLVACLEHPSRLGFWLLRRRQPLATELRVYPNLFSERRALAAVFLDRGQIGAKLHRTVGRGREFEKLREYLPGDGFDEIHWKATAKRGRPVTKVFQAERTQEIYVVIDASRLSGRAVTHEGVTATALERYLTATMVLLLAAQRQGDRFGLIAYDETVRVFLRAGSGTRHYGACREAIHTLQPAPGAPDLGEIVRQIRTRLRQRALLFFLTDLSDPVLAEEFAAHARLLARQHLVLVNQVRAPGIAPLFHREVRDADEIFDRLAGHERWAEARALGQTLRHQGIATALLEDEQLAAELVSQYLSVKRRQAL